MSSSSDSQAHKAVTFETGDGNDWGVIEDANRRPKALGPSEVKREVYSLGSFGFVIQWYRIHCTAPGDKKNRRVCFA